MLRRVLRRQVTCSAVCRTVVPLNLEGSAFLSTGIDLAVHFVLAEVFVTCAPAPLVSYVHIRRAKISELDARPHARSHTNLVTLSLIGTRVEVTLSSICVSKDPHMCDLIVPPTVQLSCSGGAFYDVRFRVSYMQRERER